jgi:hypothetical protein
MASTRSTSPMERTVAIGIGVLAAAAAVIALTMMFGSTQPFRTINAPMVVTE